jgi:hypothetical protein
LFRFSFTGDKIAGFLYLPFDSLSNSSRKNVLRCILREHGYPADKQEKATQTVLQQAELLCADWAG